MTAGTIARMTIGAPVIMTIAIDRFGPLGD
jgi:hypothetical protein